MFGLYFYLIGVLNTLIAVLVAISIALCIMLFNLLIDIDFCFDSEKESINKKIKRLIKVISVVLVLIVFIPGEDTIKGIMFDKLVVNKVDIIKEDARNMIDYAVDKIKELK